MIYVIKNTRKIEFNTTFLLSLVINIFVLNANDVVFRRIVLDASVGCFVAFTIEKQIGSRDGKLVYAHKHERGVKKGINKEEREH